MSIATGTPICWCDVTEKLSQLPFGFDVDCDYTPTAATSTLLHGSQLPFDFDVDCDLTGHTEVELEEKRSQLPFGFDVACDENFAFRLCWDGMLSQ